MSKYKTIKAFGLQTRYWEYHPTYGYGCAECCNGDRCDEDCAAKYKGNRVGCPHCKGKGWIRVEDLDPVNTPISPELQQIIENDASAKAAEYSNAADGMGHFSSIAGLEGYQYGFKEGYEAGATAYAHYKERFEQAKKALDRLKSVADCYSYIPSLNPPIKHLQSIINEALASWKEEGKGGNNG